MFFLIYTLVLQVMNEDGHTTSIKDKILTIEVKPGWTEGTRIIFSKEGDQVRDVLPIICHESKLVAKKCVLCL